MFKSIISLLIPFKFITKPAVKSHNKENVNAVSLMKDGIDITKESHWYFRKLFVITNFNTSNIASFYFIAFWMSQTLMFVTEVVVFGEPRATFLDVFITLMLCIYYFVSVNRLADFLIAQTVKPKKQLIVVK